MKTQPKKPVEKICTTCGVAKTLNLFEVDRRQKTGITGRCKRCKFLSNNKAARAFRRLYEKQVIYPIEIETSREEVTQIFELFESRCAYCYVEESEETKTFELEHIIPLSKGGRHHKSNLVISCKSCNSKKGNRSLFEFHSMSDDFTVPYLVFIVKYVAYFLDKPFADVWDEFQTQHDENEKAIG